MEYDKEFEAAYKVAKPKEEGVFSMHDVAFAIWQAARKDHYRIGEEVEARAQLSASFVRGVVTALISEGFAVDQPDNVRRIPAKSRIDEIAEDCWHEINKCVTGLPVEVIKRALLNARHEWEAN